MITIKKNKSFIALVLLAITINTCAMEPETPDRSLLGWAALAGGVIVGAIGVRQFLSYIRSEPITPFPFDELPPEMQNTIISLLTENSTAPTLDESARTINALAQVNKELNRKINSPDFCLQLIKYLAQKFNCSDMQAAQALKTEEAKRRIALQKNILPLSAKRAIPATIDINFTYDLRAMNGTNLLQITLLNYTLSLWVHQPLLRDQLLPVIRLLLAAGADPETIDNEMTPLGYAQQINDQELIDLITDAIAKKYARQ